MNRVRPNVGIWSVALVTILAGGCVGEGDGWSSDGSDVDGPTNREPDAGGDSGGDSSEPTLDRRLRERLEAEGIEESPATRPADAEKVELGRNLFFDKILSGNRDVACVTCHHPDTMSGDGRSLPVGVGGKGMPPERRRGQAEALVPRNSPELFARGLSGWETMFWDGRVAEKADGDLSTPAGDQLQEGLDGVLAAQAMFPVTSRHEMRGHQGDDNELSAIEDGEFTAIWAELMDRLVAISGYRRLFRQAYPSTPIEKLRFRDAANAIAAFERRAFLYSDSPFDRYLDGETNAMTEAQKRGALLFYGKAGCSSCHSGRLMTDQKFHNIAAPQIGPGKAPHKPLDPGRYLVSDDPSDKFAFRTPPLRNVAVTGPYLHSGAYDELREVIEHHLRPRRGLRQYDGGAVSREIRKKLHDGPQVEQQVLETLDNHIRTRAGIQTQPGHPRRVDEEEVGELVEFLHALTSPTAANRDRAIIPESVPSGLPVE